MVTPALFHREGLKRRGMLEISAVTICCSVAELSLQSTRISVNFVKLGFQLPCAGLATHSGRVGLKADIKRDEGRE